MSVVHEPKKITSASLSHMCCHVLCFTQKKKGERKKSAAWFALRDQLERSFKINKKGRESSTKGKMISPKSFAKKRFETSHLGFELFYFP